MNKNTERYYQSALAYFLPVNLIPDIAGFEIRLAGRRYFFRSTETSFNVISSSAVAGNKYWMNQLLKREGLPVPEAVTIRRSEFEEGLLDKKIADLMFPMVLKPASETSRGEDVLCNIQNKETLQSHLENYFKRYEYLLIEEFHGQLNSYRVLVFNRKVIGVVLRHPACVIGDGEHNLQELIEQTNRQRQEINDVLAPIVVDDECWVKLNELGIDLDYVPKPGESVTLCYTSNATRGGTYQSLDKRMCQENRRMMSRVARVLDLNLTGIDVLCQDIINVPIEQSAGVILEANRRPSIRIHEEPLDGVHNFVTRTMIRSIICRHPLAYLYSLYRGDRTAIYVKGLISLILFGLVFKLLMYV